MRGLFPNALHIARREYLQRVRNRSFVIMTAILAVVGAGLVLLPIGFRALGGDKPTIIGVVSTATAPAADPVTQLEALLNAAAGSASGAEGSGAPPSASPRFSVSRQATAGEGQVAVRDGKLDGLLVVSRAANGDQTFDFYSKLGPTSATVALVQQAAAQLSIADRLARAGLAPDQRARIFAATPFTLSSADPAASSRSGKDSAPAYLLATVFVVLTFMAVLTYGNWIAGSVAEEKSNRVMELLITAATPRQLMLGKILGTGTAGLTQYAVILGAALVGFALQGPIGRLLLGSTPSGGPLVSGLSVGLLLVYGLFFVGGFALYSTLYAAAGSTVSRQEDVQQVAGPMVIVAMAGYFAGFFAVSSVDAAWVAPLSYVPFFSPYLIPARLTLSQVAPWEIVLALGLLVVAIAAALWIAARIYSAGVLLYGQRLSLREVWRAARVSR